MNKEKFLIFGIVLLLVGLIGLNFYGSEIAKEGYPPQTNLKTERSSGNLLTGAAVGLAGPGGLEAFSSNCYSYTASSCTAANGCKWRNDSWSSTGWCEELNCWSLNSQSDCASTSVPGKSCSWTPGNTFYSCEKLSCWSLSGTSASSCVNNSLNLACDWSSQCYSSGSNPSPNCWQQSTQSACLNNTGCSWGQCMDKGCWTYNSASSCTGGKDFNGRKRNIKDN